MELGLTFKPIDLPFKRISIDPLIEHSQKFSRLALTFIPSKEDCGQDLIVTDLIHLTSKLSLDRIKSLEILSHNNPCMLSPEFADDSHLRRLEIKYSTLVEISEQHLRIPNRLRDLKIENAVIQ